MNRETLEKIGLSKEQIDQVIAEHGKTVQSLQSKLTTAEDRVKTLEVDIDNASKLVSDLKKSNKDAEALQAQIKEYEDKVKGLETQRAQERKSFAIKEALTKAGATDIEYMMYKLGDIEVDKDGAIKDLESKVKQLKETNPSFFPTQDPTEPPKGGYKPIDTKLPSGQTKQLDIANMTPAEINANWDVIKQQSKKQ